MNDKINYETTYLNEEFFGKHDNIFFFLPDSKLTINKWNCGLKKMNFLIIDNSIGNHLETQNVRLIGHINFP